MKAITFNSFLNKFSIIDVYCTVKWKQNYKNLDNKCFPLSSTSIAPSYSLSSCYISSL